LGFTITEKIADHYFTGLVLESSVQFFQENEKIEPLNKKINDSQVIKDLEAINWDYLMTIKCPTELYDQIENKIKDVYNSNTVVFKHGNKKHKCKKRWLTPSTYKLIQEKNTLWLKMKRRNSVDNALLENYRKLKNLVSKKVKNDKQNFIKSEIERNLDKKMMWTQIHKITGKDVLNIDEQLIKTFTDTSLEITCNKFNENFVGQVKKLKNKYNRQTTVNCLTPTVTNSMIIMHADETAINSIISNMKVKKSVGTDGFHMEHLLKINNIAKIICPLINCIIDNETWPTKLKTQVLRPIFKKGDKSNVDNYRPIAIQPVINKIVEKYFAIQIQSFLEKFNVISNVQFGFQKNKGTVDALNLLNNKIATALNNGFFVGSVLIDLQKAFDTLNRDTLINKLANHGIRGKILNILIDYLTNRTSFVRIQDKLSEKLLCEDGVPQGSILGPILFLIYINDLVNFVDKECILLFADDIFLLSIHQNYLEMKRNLQLNFNKIVSWSINNYVFISEDKTVALDIKTPHMTIPQIVDIWMHSECNGLCNNKCCKLKRVQQAKYLGFKLDENWKHKEHVMDLINRLRCLMPKLYQIRNFLDLKNRKIIYNAWVLPHFLYAIEIFGFSANYQLFKLQKIQNKIVKILFKPENIDINTRDIYIQNAILNIINLRDYKIIINNFFEVINATDIRKINAERRKNLKLFIPRWRNLYGKKIKDYYLPQLMNKLPLDILMVTTYNKLKSALKKWLLRRD
jgi:hypothetical protein